MKKVAILAAMIGAFCFAAPAPSLAPAAGIWTLDVQFAQPLTLSMKIGDKAEKYWYTVLTLTNNTGEDVSFIPKCELMTDTWQVTQSDTGIVKPVYDRIKLINQGRYPFLQTLDEAPARILEGEDNKVDVLVVWKDFDKNAKSVKMFFAGLSNETSVVNIPDKKNPDEMRKIILKKSLSLEYNIPGDSKKRSAQQLEFSKRGWVMR